MGRARSLEFKGIPPPLGWQGVIPRNAGRMARVAVDLMISRPLSPQEIIDRIDIVDMQTRRREPIMQVVDGLARDGMAK